MLVDYRYTWSEQGFIVSPCNAETPDYAMQMYATHLALLSNSTGAQKNSLGGKQKFKMDSYKESQNDYRQRKKVIITDSDLYNSTKAKKTLSREFKTL